MNSDGTNLVQLAPPKGIYNFPHISPHFDEIAFMRDGGIATISTDGSNLQWIRTKTDSTSCITPLYIDQNRILYTEGSSAEMSLRLFDKLRRQDTVIAYLSSGVGYDGRTFVRGKLVYNYLNVIKILDVNALTSRSLAKGFDPAFSSDGSRIVFRDDRSIYTMNSDGSNQKTLYSEPDSSRYVATPQFSADDKNIIFITSYTVITP
ncbi:MAG TPA: hypothetical protein VK141_03065, partial [Nitrosomonas sp.]|nr:hypothetical protein [Nitrosomonas sp.]